MRDFGTKTVHLVIIALDFNQVGAVNMSGDDFFGFEVGGNEDEGLEAGGGGLRRYGIGEIARRGAAHSVKPEFARFAERHRHDAILEGERGVVDRVVLDVKLARSQGARQARGGDERSESRLLAHPGLAVQRQQLTVPPHVCRTLSDVFAPQVRPQLPVIVNYLQRRPTLFTSCEGFQRICPLAFPAFEMNSVTHNSSNGFAAGCLRTL